MVLDIFSPVLKNERQSFKMVLMNSLFDWLRVVQGCRCDKTHNEVFSSVDTSLSDISLSPLVRKIPQVRNL